MPTIDTLDQLLIHEVADLLNAEEQLVEALPKMAEAATASDLKAAITEHHAVTVDQAAQLGKVAELLGMQASDKTICKATKGLLAEGQEAVKMIPAGPVRDSAIIGASRRVEHYEIAAYSSAAALAQSLGQTEVGQLLQAILEQEMAADQTLAKLAQSMLQGKK